jgi:hypothetical protein
MKWFGFAATFCFISAGSFFCIANDGHPEGSVSPDLSVPLYRYYDDATREEGQTSDTAGQGNNDFLLEELDRQAPQPDINDSTKLWFRKSVQDTLIGIRESNEVAPEDRSGELDYRGSEWSQTNATPKVFAWAAPDIRYQPLYFEDVALERYGQTMGLHLQPYRSGLNFFKSLVFLPNQMRHDPPCSCDYPLGFCRPGTCVPDIRQQKFFGVKVR